MRVVILGAGQQGRVCCKLAAENGYEPYAFVDDFKEGEVEGLPVYRRIEDVPGFAECRYHVAIGEIEPRKKYCDELARLGLGSVNLIDSTAHIEEGAEIGTGNYIYKFAIIYASAKIGDNNIINCKTVLATDSRIGSNNNISMGCNICGGVKIGNNCYIGCQSSVVSGKHIGNDVVVGAGSVVLDDVWDGMFVAGAPAARKERRRT